MNGAKNISGSLAAGIPAIGKRVILSMGGVGIMPLAGLCRMDSSFPKSNGSTHVFEAA